MRNRVALFFIKTIALAAVLATIALVCGTLLEPDVPHPAAWLIPAAALVTALLVRTALRAEAAMESPARAPHPRRRSLRVAQKPAVTGDPRVA